MQYRPTKELKEGQISMWGVMPGWIASEYGNKARFLLSDRSR